MRCVSCVTPRSFPLALSRRRRARKGCACRDTGTRRLAGHRGAIGAGRALPCGSTSRALRGYSQAVVWYSPARQVRRVFMISMLRAAALISLLGALMLPSAASLAQDYPSRPVRLIVPLGAGGPADLVGRYVAQALGERLKQSFFVENRPGAAGLIGTAEAAKAPPDGYTLLVVASPHINLEILSHNKQYQLMRDFMPVASVFSTDAIMVVHPSVPAKTVKEFIALAKSKP